MATVKSKSNMAAFTVLADRMHELAGKQVSAGWFKTAKYENGTPVAYVASIQEFGVASKSIPPRPFMRPTIAAKTPEWRKIVEQGAKQILKGTQTIDGVLGQLGQSASDGIKESIIAVTAPPLSPITLELRAMKRKGIEITGKTVGEAAHNVAQEGYVTPDVSTKPLVDEGIMLATATFLVEDVK